MKLQIGDRHLAPGSKLPSIRDLAKTLNVSRFTVVEAYDRLVAMGYLQSRPGAGFYVAALAASARLRPRSRATSETINSYGWFVSFWRLTRTLPSPAAHGCQIPGSTRPAFAKASTRSPVKTDPICSNMAMFGYLPLREHLTLMLAGLGITAQSDQILLTNGTSQALDLVITCLLKPGDVALVDDPGYYNMFGNLRLRRVECWLCPAS